MRQTISFRETAAMLYSGSTFTISGDIDVTPGKWNILLGDNGAGKSLMLSVIAAALNCPNLGIVSELGTKFCLSGQSKKIGILRQEPYDNFISRCSADEFILPLISRYLTKEEIIEELDGICADVLNNPSLLTRHAASLSGGEAQSLSLAASFLGNPDVLLLDEPLTRVDMGNSEKLVNMLKNKKNTCYFIATHKPKIFKKYLLDDIDNNFDILRVNKRGNHIVITKESDCNEDIQSCEVPLSSKAPESPEISSVSTDNNLKTLIKIKNLRVVNSKHPNEEIVRLNSGNIKEGLNILYGCNGSGKTTIGKVLAGTIPLNPFLRREKRATAEVSIIGTDVLTLGDLRKTGRSVFLAAEPDNWLSEETCYKEIELHSSDENSIKTELKKYGLEADTDIEKLSYGQKKILSLLALPNDMFLVVLDEPFEGLSVEMCKLLFSLIQTKIQLNLWRSVVILTNNNSQLTIFEGTNEK